MEYILVHAFVIKNLILASTLVFSFSLKAQVEDSIPKQFENFFGSDCDVDTLVLKSVRNSEIVFYKNEGRLICLKNGKDKWEVDLSSLAKEYPDESFCIIQRGIEGKPREMYLFIVFVSDDKSHNLVIRSMNGKIISGVTKK